MTIQAKYIYLARRHPSLDPAGFVRRWRQHGALGMSMPRWTNVRRYVHCDTLAQPADVAGVRNDFDGIGMIWYRSLAARTSHARDNASQAAMEADEAETFDRPVAAAGVLCAEQVLCDAAPQGLKLVRFVTRPPALAEAAFDASWQRHLDAVRHWAGTEAGGPRRHVVNRPLPPEGTQGWGLAVEAVEELWFDDPTSLARWCGVVQHGLAQTPDPQTWSATIAVVTREAVLYDRP